MKQIFPIGAALFAVAMFVGCGDQKLPGSASQPNKPQAATSAQVLERFENVTVKLNSSAVGHIDGINGVTSPKTGSIIVVSGDKIVITGNFVDAVKGEPAAGVVVVIGGKPYGTVYGGERPDVAKVLNNPKYLKIQFYLEVPTVTVSKGLHDLKIRVIAADKSGYFESDWFAKLDVK